MVERSRGKRKGKSQLKLDSSRPASNANRAVNISLSQCIMALHKMQLLTKQSLTKKKSLFHNYKTLYLCLLKDIVYKILDVFLKGPYP